MSDGERTTEPRTSRLANGAAMAQFHAVPLPSQSASLLATVRHDEASA